MRQLQSKWNATSSIVEPLQKAGFSARIGYGFKGEGAARGMLVIEHGRAIDAGPFDGGELDWDLRAEPQEWASWIEEGFGLTKLGPAVATGALEFVRGNYRQMIRNVSLSNPFMQHFELMHELGVGD
ncbi:MAG: SCP-2 sterol transfer family protein [Gammaproteobacteria bacterium]|nr:SCP-2 sterol transfer family protein [Gammaproteobacteria bacterium]